MRLPFMQLESDFLAHGAAELSHLARCSPAQAIGHVSLLRAWAVSHATDDAPPDGWVGGDSAERRIEAAAQWTGAEGVLLLALVDAGQVRREPGGVRVLHLQPYVDAWNKNRTAKERMRNMRERSANRRERSEHANDTPGERSAKFPQQTQTQTQMQKKEETSSAVASAPPAASLELVPVEPPKRKPGKSNACGEFIDWFRAETRKQLAADAPDNCRMEPHQAARLGEAVKLHGLETCKSAVGLWMGWEGSRAAGYPLGMFAAKWEGWVGRVKAPTAATTQRAEVAVGRGGGEENAECAGCGRHGYAATVGPSGDIVRLGAACGCWKVWEDSGVSFLDAPAWARNRRAGRAA